jgi:antitoxin (DNA-binding transcriptional repressor) of toxin-antitoxin stability system
MATRITHREMRNQSGDILRRAAAGEIFEVTNNGVVAAQIGPPQRDLIDELIASGQARAATRSIRDLPRPGPNASGLTAKEILDDIRGPW